MRLSASLAAVTAVLIGAALPASAQFPERPVRIVVPFPPGGGTDILARLTGRHLNDFWKQPVIIDNRPGANGQIGMEIVARADHNGHTLVALAAGPLDEHNLKYFSPVALFAAPPYLFVIHPSVKATSVKELIALAKAQPGKLNYGSTGGGAASHLSTELFKAMAGVDIHHIPYKGIGQASTELLGGQVQMLIGPSQALIPHVKSGKLRALGITSGKRLATMPDIPTVAESGLPGYEAYGWFGLAAPARTPTAVLNTINGAVNKALQLPEMKSRLAELGAEPGNHTPGEFLAFIRRENAKWDKLIKDQNIEIQRPRLNL